MCNAGAHSCHIAWVTTLHLLGRKYRLLAPSLNERSRRLGAASGRVRRPGGGRKRAAAVDPRLSTALDSATRC